MNDLTNLFHTGKEKKLICQVYEQWFHNNPETLLVTWRFVKDLVSFGFIGYHLLKTYAKFFEILIFLTN